MIHLRRTSLIKLGGVILVRCLQSVYVQPCEVQLHNCKPFYVWWTNKRRNNSVSRLVFPATFYPYQLLCTVYLYVLILPQKLMSHIETKLMTIPIQMFQSNRRVTVGTKNIIKNKTTKKCTERTIRQLESVRCLILSGSW